MADKLDTTGEPHSWRVPIDADASAKQAYRDYLGLVERILEDAIKTKRNVAISKGTFMVDRNVYYLQSLYIFLKPDEDPGDQLKKLPPASYWTLYLTATEEAEGLLRQVQADRRK